MSKLLKKPQGSSGKIHDISAKSAGWGYVGFSLYILERGQNISQDTLDQEVILVLVEGHAEVTADGKKFGILGIVCMYLKNHRLIVSTFQAKQIGL